MSEFERLSSHDLVKFLVEEIQLFNELCDIMESSAYCTLSYGVPGKPAIHTILNVQRRRLYTQRKIEEE